MNREEAIDLSKKLLDFSRRGNDAENMNAEEKMLSLLKKYDIKLEEIDSNFQETRIFKYKSSEQKTFLLYVISNVTGNERNSYNFDEVKKEHPQFKNTYGIDCTESEFVEISEKYEFFWNKYKKDKLKIQEEMMKAFLIKNKLTSKGAILYAHEMTDEEIERHKKLQELSNVFDKHDLLKKLDN